MSNIENQLNKMLKSNGKISNTQGINLAYDSPNKVYIKDNNMYIAGTSSANDVLEDLTKLPFGVLGGVKDMQRYITADEILKQNPHIDTLVGHSAGGAVVLKLSKEYPERNFKTRTYNSPTFSLGFEEPNEQHKRFRKVGDVVSALDGSAINYNTDSLNPLSNHKMEVFENIDETIPPLTLP